MARGVTLARTTGEPVVPSKVLALEEGPDFFGEDGTERDEGGIATGGGGIYSRGEYMQLLRVTLQV